MASQDSANSPELIVGSLVSFTWGGAFYEGTVYDVDPEDASFGIEDVSRTTLLAGALSNTRLLAGDIKVEGQGWFFLKDITGLRVIREPSPKPTTNTTEDDEETTPGESSSPKPTTNTTEDDEKTTPSEEASSTSTSK